MASIVIHGFASEEAANEFVSWYSNQGEQQSEIWFDHRGMSSPSVDTRKTWHSGGKYDPKLKKDENGNLIAYVE